MKLQNFLVITSNPCIKVMIEASPCLRKLDFIQSTQRNQDTSSQERKENRKKPKESRLESRLFQNSKPTKPHIVQGTPFLVCHCCNILPTRHNNNLTSRRRPQVRTNICIQKRRRLIRRRNALNKYSFSGSTIVGLKPLRAISSIANPGPTPRNACT